MRGCVHARRTLKGLVADLRLIRKNSLIPKFICIFGIMGFYFINYYSFWKQKNYRWLQNMNINIATNIKINKHLSTTLFLPCKYRTGSKKVLQIKNRFWRLRKGILCVFEVTMTCWFSILGFFALQKDYYCYATVALLRSKWTTVALQ